MIKKRRRYINSHRMVKGVKQKLCIDCGKWKPESNFHKDGRASKDGLKPRCKECVSVYQRELERRKGIEFRENLRYEDRHRTVGGIKRKLCSRCKEWKGESEFHRNIASPDGLQWMCKKCVSQRFREYYERFGDTLRRTPRYEDYHWIVDGIKQKLCSRCKEWKDESDFYRRRASTDGLQWMCKGCSNEYALIRCKLLET